jgi:hypothetical protein
MALCGERKYGVKCKKMGFPKKFVKLCRIINSEIYAKVKTDKRLSSEFNKGWRYGDAPAPLLFKIMLEISIRKSK